MDNAVLRSTSTGLSYHAFSVRGYEYVFTDWTFLEPSLPLPAIIHSDGSPTAPVGHFTLIVGIGKHRTNGRDVVYTIDPITAAEHQTPVAEFERYWSTYAIIKKLPRGSPLAEALPYLSLAGMLAVLAALWVSERINRGRNTMLTAPLAAAGHGEGL